MGNQMSGFENKYAVVGLGGIFPGASDVGEFWDNIVNKRVSIQRLAADSLEREVFFRPEVKNKQDKQDYSYTELHAPLKALNFDPERFRLPPAVAKHMDDNQKLALMCASEALGNGALASVAKDRVCVFMGTTMIGRLFTDLMRRCAHRELLHVIRKRQPACHASVSELSAELLAGTFAVTEDTAPGLLQNIYAARVASVFDLHGHTFTVDAACASGLASVICGIQQLRSGEADAVICGAADMASGPEGRILFSGIGALSPDGSFPFDARANGFVIGQGGGAVVLKRLRDAIEAGDDIHAVVVGYGQCSDGKGKAIAAPNEHWQAESIRRACVMADAPVASIEMIETHGTATQVGDISEVAAMKRCFAELGATAEGYCGLTSVKSNIGHLKGAAGISGFIKAVMALRHAVLPPVASFENENPKLGLAGSPFYVIKEARQWPARMHPRRAGVSAFAFGGADYHVLLEEYRAGDYPRLDRKAAGSRSISSRSEASDHPTPAVAAPHAGLWQDPVSGASHGSSGPDSPEIALFSADTRLALLEQVDALLAQLQRSATPFARALFAHNAGVRVHAHCRLGMTAHNAEELATKAALVRGASDDHRALAGLTPRGIYFSSESPIRPNQLVLMFPGQGSQYPDMILPLAARFAAARTTIARADALWQASHGATISGLFDSTLRGAQATEGLLRETRNTHPSLMLASLATYRILEEAGLRAGATVGHSLGEYTALAATGVLSFADGFELMRARGEAFSLLQAERAGAMLALSLSEAQTLRVLEEAHVTLALANLNAKQQTIVSGSLAEIERLQEYCSTHELEAKRLNVSHAFHSPMMRPAEERFRDALARVRLGSPTMRVIANSDNEYYTEDVESIRTKLGTQITASVRFAASIERLYADGYRAFVEVGPSSVLSSCTRDILANETVTVLSSDSRKGDSLEAFCRLLCGLFALGLPVDPCACSRVAQTTTLEPSAPRPEPEPERATDATGSRGSDPLSRIVYSGVSVGLPGSFKESFRDDNFEQLFLGHNLIERLTDSERQRLADLRITKLIKSEQGASYATLEALDQVIQLAGKVGRLNLPRDYHIDEKDAANMSSAIAHAVAAGYEALRDAHIPLVHEYAQTASGGVLPDRWALPSDMQSSTGVIFANGFPMVDPIVAEVSRHLSYRFGSRVKQELLDFYDSLIEKVTHRESRKILADWFALNYARLCGTPSQSDVYSFNHQLMTQIAMQANNRLAKAIAARGPNFQINAACSSTATAVTLAEELIRGGRARRMIVIGADDPSSDASLPYLGGGFLSTGACTSEGDLYAAAVPFDKRRNGMIMGAGAVGLVVEASEDCAERGVTAVCELVGTHCFNTASHGSQLDVPRYAEELERFVARLERERGLSRQGLASRLVYVSHETYTPARGGCSEAEAVALRHVFGERFTEIEISNTKGMTGHTMGASIEDATAAKALQYGRIPPVVNHRIIDPVLEGLKLSKGGERSVDYALRMAAGFGSQGNFLLLGKLARGDDRIFDRTRYTAWLNRISGLDDAEVAQRGRLMVVRDSRPGSVLSSRPSVGPSRPPRAPSGIKAPRVPSFASPSENPSTSAAQVTPAASHSSQQVQTTVLEILSEVTGYATAMLDLDMELEADLGVDTVKQATVLARLAERFGLAEAAEVRLSEYPTVRRIVEFFSTQTQAGPTPPAGQTPARCPPAMAAGARATPVGLEATGACACPPRASAQPSASASSTARISDIVRRTIAEVTGYSLELLSAELELEADLGVDTVKQATILGMLSERFGASDGAELKMSELTTIADVIALFSRLELSRTADVQRPGPVSVPRAPDPSPTKALADVQRQEPVSVPRAPDPSATKAPADDDTLTPPSLAATAQPRESDGESTPQGIAAPAVAAPVDVLSRLYAIVADHSPYPASMLESDLTLSSDMGLAAEALDRIRQGVVDCFALEQDYRLPTDATLSELASGITAALRERRMAGLEKVPLARQAMTPLPAPLRAERQGLSGRRIWVIGDEASTLRVLRDALQALGATVSSLQIPASGNLDELDTALQPLLASAERPDALLDATLSPRRVTQQSGKLALDRAALTRTTDCRFWFWKRLRESSRIPRRVLAITCIDGRCGTARAETNTREPLYGFAQGFYRTLRKELADCRITLLDTQSSDWQGEAPTLVRRVSDELATESEGIDICYVDEQRCRLALVDVPRQALDAGARLADDEVFLVTGGGAGITSALMVGLARVQPISVALVGRTALDDAARHFHALSAQGKVAEKERLTRQLAQSSARVTPVMVERAYAELQRADEILCTLRDLRAAGCRAEYYSADVTDLDRLRSVVDSVRRTMGPITTLVHGAGVELSHSLEHKSLEEFRRIHLVKTLGAYHLALLCEEEPLRRVIAMSSISGVLGSDGQLDYSGANAFLDLWVDCLGKGRARGLSLLWSSWAQRGIASRSEFLKKNADAIGVLWIEPEAGVSAALYEILDPTLSRVVLHRGISGLLPAESSATTPRTTPMIDWVERRSDRERVFHRRFSTARDLLLDQHRLSGTPLMPGVGFMEWMAEASAVLAPDRTGVLVFRQLQFLDAFKLYRDAARDTELMVQGPDDAGSYEMRVLAPPSGRLAGSGDRKLYSRALVSIEERAELERQASGWELGELQPSSMREELAHAPEFRQNVVFGPLLNDAHHPNHVSTPDIEWGSDGIVTRVALPRAQIEERRYPLEQYLVNPAFLDAMHQAGAILAIKLTGQVFLPVGAREFVILHCPNLDGEYRVVARLTRRDVDEFLYDIAFWHDARTLCAVAWDVSFHRISQ